jgi:O-antigen/teichoic acid export membrane protein
MQDEREADAAAVRSGVAWTALQSGLGLVLGLLRVVLLARLVQPADHGRFAVVASVVAIASPLYSLVGERAYITLAPRVGPDSTGLLTIVRWASATTTIVLLVGALAAQGVTDWTDAVPLGLLSVAAGATAAGQARLARHAVEFRFRWAAIVRFLSSAAVHTGVAVLLALLGAGLWSLVGGVLAEAASLNFLSRVGQKVPETTGPSVREILGVSLFMLAARVVGQAALNADNLIAAFALGATEAGYYTRAYALANIPQALTAAMIARVLLPVLSKRSANPIEFGAAVDTTVIRGLSLLLPIAVSVYFEAPRVVVFLLGEEWARSGVVLSVLAPAIMFRGLAAIAVSSLDSKGHVRRTLFIQCVYAGAVAVGAGLGARFGLEGLATGTVIATVLHAVLSWSLASRVHDGSWVGMRRGIGLSLPWALSIALLELQVGDAIPFYLMWVAHSVLIACAFALSWRCSRNPAP